MLNMIRGWGASVAAEAAARIGVLAEKNGEIGWLAKSLTASYQAYIAGRLSNASRLVDEAFQRALGEGNPTAMAWMHTMQLAVRFYRGDLTGAENHFAPG